MKATKFVVAVIAATAMSAAAIPAIAYEAGDWLIRGRIVNVNPNDDSGALSVIDKDGKESSLPRGASVNEDTIPELDITYMLSPNWGAELILGYSEHNVRGTRKIGEAVAGAGGGLGSKDVINTKVLPPTLTLQYHFAPNSDIKPYVGAGINYTNFFGEAIPSKSGISKEDADVTLKGSWGLAAQAGVDIALNSDWFVNLDVKYIDIDTTGEFKDTTVGHAKIDVDIDPFVFGIGIGRKF